MIRDMFKNGLRYRILNCVGAPQDKIACYENTQLGIVISNITAIFDTLVVEVDNRVV